MKVLSLFDGMSCGMLALMGTGVKVERYVAYEIDKYAVQTSMHNFPMIEHRGDVFQGDFTEFNGFDLLMGGSPCTYWSIAQSPDKRETTASGLGWELFCQYVGALREAKPKYFIYENNKSMSNAIRKSITETFGFEPICINSALVSAQNRQRFYWVGKREADGTYSKVNVEQPTDRGILLKDILEYNTDREKSRAIIGSIGRTPTREYFMKQQGQMAIEPVCVAQRGRYNENNKVEQHFEAREDGKTNVVTTVQKDNMVAEPIKIGALPRPNGELSTSQAFRIYDISGKAVSIKANSGGAGGKTGLYAVPVCMRYERSPKAKAVRKDYEAGKIHHGFHELSELHPRADGKTNTLSTVLKDNPICEPVCYAEPCEWDENGRPTKAISSADGKTYTVYEVKNGIITIKGKEYPIKLQDGLYIIRKLTVGECMRLQTVPEWYEFPVSNTRALRMLGNGWSVDVIVHLLNSVKECGL